MKKWILAYAPFILIAIIFSSFLVYGHPGRTDSNGGHYDYSSDEYHYHHGYPAHQHPGGICPYDYASDSDDDMPDDEAVEQGRKAGEELLQKIQREREADGNSYIPWEPGAPFNPPEASSSFDSNDESSSDVLNEETSTNVVPEESISLNESIVSPEPPFLLKYITKRGYTGTIVRVGLVCILVCSVIIAFRAGKNSRAKLISQLEDAVAKKDRTISDLEAQNNELSQALKEKSSQCTSLEIAVEDLKSQKVVLNNQLMALREKHVECALSPEEIAKLAGVPEGVTFDDELLPHYYCNEIVENNLHVYVSNKGKCYHRKRGCSGAEIPIHLFTAASQFAPCHKCIPYRGLFYKIPAWYYRYIQFATESDISSTIRHKMDGLD